MEWINWNSSQNRTWAGSCLKAFPDDYIVIDIETTGLNSEKDDIIEISAIKYSDNRKVASFHRLLKPTKPLENSIIQLTGITNEMLEQATEPNDALLDFYNFVTEDKDQQKVLKLDKVENPILMAYNAPFDIGFLYDHLAKQLNLYLSNDFVDVLLLARKLVPNMAHHRQVDMAKYFHISTEGAHRAGDDTRMCNAVYQRLKEMFYKTYQEPLQCKELAINRNAAAKSPLAGKNFYVSGYMQFSTKYALKNLIAGLGGSLDSHFQEHTDCVILGLGKKSELETDEIKYAANIKRNIGYIKIYKEETFIKGLLQKDYIHLAS